MGGVILAFRQDIELTSILSNLLRLTADRFALSLAEKGGRHPREILTLQANLTGLIAKIIDPDTELSHLLALTLEHTVLPLGASMGSIWLFGEDSAKLELSSSLLRISGTRLPATIQYDRGMIGAVMETCQPVLSQDPSQHPKFDSKTDALWANFETVLMLPLYRHAIQFGVLCLCWEKRSIVTDEELVIIESMSDLASAFIANINLVEKLSNYSTQQNALLEMSRQIAIGLDLDITLARGLQWVTRLVGVEFGMLWLADDDATEFELGACLGSGLRGTQGYRLSLNEDGYKAWKDLLGPVEIRSGDETSPFWLAYDELFGIQARDLIALPLESRGELIGVVLLINRIGGLSLETEQAMLTTAADMLALAAGNAQLHSRTLDLIEERERAHAIAIQASRMATVGRLTATLSHEINNPMQAIRGALSLAQEDLDDVEALSDYLDMCIHESDRVVELIEKMRYVYHPNSQESGLVQINDAIQSVMVFAQKVSSRQGVDIHLDMAPDLAPIHSTSDQIHLVLLSLTLFLSDAVAAAGGDQIHLRTSSEDGFVRIDYSTQGDLKPIIDLLECPDSQPLTEPAIRLAFSRDIIQTLDGALSFESQGADVIVSLELPVHMAEIAEPRGT
jgi:nitrogen-specific signal transduction histidine kinase